MEVSGLGWGGLGLGVRKVFVEVGGEVRVEPLRGFEVGRLVQIWGCWDIGIFSLGSKIA